MTDFQDLDPEIRCFALVGRFLHQWSTMEKLIHECIQTAFNLTPVMRDILCANLALQNKVNILRTVIDVTGIDKPTFNKLMRRIGTYAQRRNTVAHEAFKADDGGKGVEFSAVKAKGEYDATPIIWSTKRFDEECRLLEGIKNRLRELKIQIQENPIRDHTIIPSPLIGGFYLGHSFLNNSYFGAPMQRTMQPALMDYLSRQAQVPPDSGQASLENIPQIPDKPPQTKED